MQSRRLPARPLASTALGLAALLTAALSFGCGPLGPLPGGRLSGPEKPAAADWAFATDVHTIQLETNPNDPHSVNTWCGVVDGRLYVPTSLILGTDEPSERGWVRNVLADPRVRLRIDGDVYEATAVRVDDDDDERETARQVMLAKYEEEPDPHAQRAWIFRMEAR